MADVSEHAQAVRRAAVVREFASSLELRLANVLFVLAAVLAATVTGGPVAAQARLWVPGLVLAVVVPGVVHHLRRHRVVLVMSGYAATYAKIEALLHYERHREVYQDGLRIADLWVGRVRVGLVAAMLGLTVAELGGALMGVAREDIANLSPAPIPLSIALSCWVSVAMWRRCLRHEVARVTRLDSFRLMEQEGYRWTWWWGWVES